MKESRGFRNNNPLNIRRGMTHWTGQCEQQTDRAFVQFETMAHGYRAAWRVLASYYRRFQTLEKQPFCVRNIISRWAPASENDTRTYISRVSKLTNIDPDELLKAPFLDTQRFVEIISAMTCVENGISMNQVPVEYIREGFRLAFGKINEV